MTEDLRIKIELRLLRILNEIEGQVDVAGSYQAGYLSFVEEMSQIHEYLEIAGEYGLAYEYLVATIEVHPFVLSGKAAISLLEVGLLLGFKTDQKEDDIFNRRKST